MNANELADELDFIFEMINSKFPRANIFKMTEAATMLRQQADRIAELEKPVKQLSDEEVIIPLYLAKSLLQITEVPRHKRILEAAIKKKDYKMNYKMTCIYDDRIVVIKNDEVVSTVFCDNKMNKPVAWMNKDTLNLSSPLEENASWINPELMIPLYTHPVKELTDEEIYEIAKQCKAHWHSHAIDPMMFAKAILRKAQEK